MSSQKHHRHGKLKLDKTNQKWSIQRHWQHWELDTTNTSKNKTQKTNYKKTNKNAGRNQMFAKCKQS